MGNAFTPNFVRVAVICPHQPNMTRRRYNMKHRHGTVREVTAATDLVLTGSPEHWVLGPTFNTSGSYSVVMGPYTRKNLMLGFPYACGGGDGGVGGRGREGGGKCSEHRT
jgi:hypothetical protein